MVKIFQIGERVQITKGVHKGKQGTVRRCEGGGHSRKWIVLFPGGIEAPISSRSLQKIGAIVSGAHALAASTAHAAAAESDDDDSGDDDEGSSEEAENTDGEAAAGSPAASAADVASPDLPPPADPTVATIVAGREWRNLGNVLFDVATTEHNAEFRAQSRLHIKTTHLDLFQHVLPISMLRKIVEATNASTALQKKIDERELLVFFGLLVSMSSLRLPARSDYFARADPDAPNLSPNYARFMSLRRFEEILRYFRLTAFTPELEKADPWVPIRSFIDDFNYQQRAMLKPGHVLTVDESFSKWLGLSLKVKGPDGTEPLIVGLPHQQKEKRKPEGVGVELKNVCDAETGIMLGLEINEGKVAMATKPYYATLGAGTSCVLRLVEHWRSTGRVVTADSWFASVKTAKELYDRGLFFIGPVKTAHKEFPKACLSALPLESRGSYHTLQAQDGALRLIALVWMDKTRKQFIATCGSTMPDPSPIVRYRLRIQDGELVSLPLTIARPMVVKQYFDAANAIDVHNHYRQGTLELERTIRTQCWWFRLFTTMLGVAITNAFLVFRHFHPKHQSVACDTDMTSFVNQLGKELVHNTLFSASPMVLRHAQDEDDDDEEPFETEHVAAPLRSHAKYKREKGSKLRNQLRCRICGRRTAYYCVYCLQHQGNFVGICNPGETMHRCIFEHRDRLFRD